MKKTNTIVVLIVQVIAIFIFSNIYALFRPMEIFEVETVIKNADLKVELFLLKYKDNLNEMKREGYFDDIFLETGSNTESYTFNDKSREMEIYSIKRPLPGDPGSTLVFHKAVNSTNLGLLKKLKKTFSNLSAMLAILLIFTGFYLVFIYKKEKSFNTANLPPLQDYLLKLKGSELQLKNLVQEQQVNVNRQDELNKSIINNINAAIILVNPHGRVDIFNRMAEEMFSRSFAHAKNNELNKVLLPFPGILAFIEEHHAAQRNVSAEIDTGEDGKVYKVDVIPLENSGKLIIIRDISEEKNREKIDSRNKNFIMLGEMTAFLAHEIKNSLGVIYGYTRTMAPTEEKLAHKVTRVNKEINFLSSMMENFLDFSKPVKLKKKEKIELEPLLATICSEKEMAFQITGKQAVIESDKALFSSIFSNLLLNAKESGADRIEVRLEENLGQDKQKHLDIFVKDNGSGIPGSNRDKIWYPFFTTKEKGTGMGLAIIRKIVTSLNGDISLVESGSSGTVFKITFYS